MNEQWYKGTADAIYQNIYTIEKADPRYVLILGGDHIYKMDYGDMINYHIDSAADVTIGCNVVPLREGVNFGIMGVEVISDGRVSRFVEKPAEPPPLPDNPEQCLALMGIYVFTARTTYECSKQDAIRQDSDHDFGKNMIPTMLSTHKVYAFRFLRPQPQGCPLLHGCGYCSIPTSRPAWTWSRSIRS